MLFNAHNKAEYSPAHTAEHILNRTMVNMFRCPRSKNAHLRTVPEKEFLQDIKIPPAWVQEIILDIWNN